LIRRIAILLLLFSGLGALASNSYAQARCWQDENGRTTCSDRVAPDQVQYDRNVVNGQGVVVAREQGEITAEERAAMAAAERERTEQERAAEERRRYGQFLLDSYTSVGAIEAMRDRTVADIDSSISLLETNLDSQYDRLNTLHRNSQRYAPYSDRENAPAMPDILLRDIEGTESSIELYRLRLEEKKQEREETWQEFQQDIDYFRELMRRSDG